MIEFKAYGKTPRLFRDIVITEKIDGTNGGVIVHEYGYAPPDFVESHTKVVEVDDVFYGVAAQSRNRLLSPGKTTDNYGFGAWVHDRAEPLAAYLGVGRHFGEWWGPGIARGYGVESKRFSLFNVERYADAALAGVPELDVVPVMYSGPYSEKAVRNAVIALRHGGSWAAPGFMRPEGIITFHSASRQVYKTLLENDELPKGVVPLTEQGPRLVEAA